MHTADPAVAIGPCISYRFAILPEEIASFAEMDVMTPERLLSIILAIGFLAAPLIALLYGPSSGLFVLAGALAATIVMAWSVRYEVPSSTQRQLRVMIGLNAGLLIATLLALLIVNL